MAPGDELDDPYETWETHVAARCCLAALLPWCPGFSTGFALEHAASPEWRLRARPDSRVSRVVRRKASMKSSAPAFATPILEFVTPLRS
jgi:hypothetical protein